MINIMIVFRAAPSPATPSQPSEMDDVFSGLGLGDYCAPGTESGQTVAPSAAVMQAIVNAPMANKGKDRCET